MKKLKNLYHLILSYLGQLLYRDPSRRIFVIGVTGTKGKTTVIEVINAGLEGAGYKTAISSSLRIKIADQSEVSKRNTMPGRFFLQSFLREAVDADAKFAIIEVTSEGVVQHRHRGIHFDAAIMTNLQKEHLESHGGFENYREAKLEFFRHVARDSSKPKRFFLINKDDESAGYFRAAASDNKVIVYSKSNIKSNLPGDFNKYNLGAAEALLKELKISDEIIVSVLSSFAGVPGRMEIVAEKPNKIVVDYAHTPDSLEAVYKTLSKEGNLICVLGSAGGGRDKWKRPKMGEIAAKYCRNIILTDEDPYDEDPNQILSEIKSGINPSTIDARHIHEILDRREAIQKAIGLAKKNDIVVITGKGSEPYMHVAGGRKIPWSDRAAAEEFLKVG